MTILRDISILWSTIHTLILFLFLFESRFSQKKTLIISLLTMLPLIIINLVLFIIIGPTVYGTLMLFTISLPSCIVFYFLAKYRDGRFFFTFCMADTLSLEILYLTMIINHYLSPDTYVSMFILRLFLMPLLEWLAYKKLRSAYLDIQSSMSKGWWPLAAIGILFYILITLLATYPTLVMNRPQYLLPLALLFVLMPVIYLHILTTLRKQQHTYQLLHQENILRLQVANLTERLMEISAADEKFRIERHNFRHKMQTIASLAETKQYSELMQVVNEYTQDIHDTQVKRYCHLPIVDAALVFYLQQAQEKEIQVSSSFIFPQSLPVSEAELATVLANALENAITACEKLPTADRFITIQVISTPRLMIHIRNSCDGNVIFNQEHLPITYEEGHGFGTRSIAAFCQKHNVFCEFAFQNNIFSLRLIFP